MRSIEGKQCINDNCPQKMRSQCARFKNTKLSSKTSYTPIRNTDGSYFCDAFDMREEGK